MPHTINSRDAFDSGFALIKALETSNDLQVTTEAPTDAQSTNSHPLSFVFDQSCFISADSIKAKISQLETITGDEYYKQILAPAESKSRRGIIDVISVLAKTIVREEKDKALYLAEVELLVSGELISVGIVAQNKYVANGVLGASQHKKIIEWLTVFEKRNLPIITFIDTPGADASADANTSNQAHSISALISKMASLSVPTVGIIWGVGYSGGAIPLATTNVLLSVRDGVFNTIQPQGLASIARKQQLDWQTCARIVGISPYELYGDKLIEGIIDYSPLDTSTELTALKNAIICSIKAIEVQSSALVTDSEPLMEYYLKRSIADAGINVGNHQYHSIFGLAFKSLRSMMLRTRIVGNNSHKNHDLSVPEKPVTSQGRQQQERSQRRFDQWLKNSDRLIYEDNLNSSWTQFVEAETRKEDDRSYISSLFLGDPKSNFNKAKLEVLSEIAFYLFNRWQQDAALNTEKLATILNSESKDDSASNKKTDNKPSTVLDVIYDQRFTSKVIEYTQNLKQFDILYEAILSQLPSVVSELSTQKCVSAKTIDGLLSAAGLSETDAQNTFCQWLSDIGSTNNFQEFLRTVEQWKQIQHPRLSDVMFVVVSFFFEKLIPSYFECQKESKKFPGTFTPVSIGRRKDFWNRLLHATTDMRIQTVLNEIKPSKTFTPDDLLAHVYQEFIELDADLVGRDPKNFPGFSESIQREYLLSKRTSGLITGTGKFLIQNMPVDAESSADESVLTSNLLVGTFVSNHSFQAGAFDTSSAERFCRLLVYCAERSMPVVGFISSGGMQTKEGPASLFSMSVVNDKINWFVGELGLPILMFGYGDCTGGAQASLVTHPLVDTYYFSGTNMPFAGRIVVPEYLPVMATLSNYLVKNLDSMKGLVIHPFVDDLDTRLKKIDSSIPVAPLSLLDVVHSWLTHQELPQEPVQTDTYAQQERSFEPYKSVLIHARGCTAVKLIREAQAINLSVILVQSDPDMDSVAADMLGENDHLVCIGGYTSDESYLNGSSVLRVAEFYQAEAIHPGIGFLSENHQFAQQCLAQGLNFIGPSPHSMETMGDKTRAIHTAISNDVPVVPGSHGILPNIEAAKIIAGDIGYPIILKAVHGGGGKGILVVEQEEDLPESFARIQAEAKSSFGSDAVYLERLVTRFRHIEVQLLRDSFGCTQIIGIRDCSVQRNKQKIVEESFSTALIPEQYDIAVASTEKLANACDYQGAGTVEFIYDLDKQSLYFMEMNTRLQVEHPVTEKVSGINIVQAQYNIAMGESIKELVIKNDGYALEVRINAEQVRIHNSELHVMPCPGSVTTCEFPEVAGIDSIVTIGAGKSIPPFYDNLIAQVIAHGNSREETLKFMIEYLDQIQIEGVDTNIELLKFVLADEVFIAGDYDTDYLVALTKRKKEVLSQALKVDDSASTTKLEQSIQIADSEELKVFSPTTSIVYHSATPEQPAYVKEGDIITVDQTICLLEVMKMFQPLNLRKFNQGGEQTYPSDQKYQVMHVKGADGQQVNKGDLLFVIKPIISPDSTEAVA